MRSSLKGEIITLGTLINISVGSFANAALRDRHGNGDADAIVSMLPVKWLDDGRELVENRLVLRVQRAV